MKKSEYIKLKEDLRLEKKRRKDELRTIHKNQKAQYKEYKKGYKEAKKALSCEFSDKKQLLVEQYCGYEFEKDVPQKDLNEQQLRALRSSRRLPFYFHGEEVFNSVTHIVGGGLGIIGLVLGIVFSVIYRPGDVLSLLSMIVFGVTMIALYSVSAIYHGLHINKGKKVFQVLDHCTIYLLISGTYTPAVYFGLSSLKVWPYVFLGGIYLLSILGIVLNATMMEKLPVKIISMILYIAVGWGILPFYPVLVENLGLAGTWLIVAGGISYTVGSILYGIGSKKKYFHSVFHLFVNVGTILQYLGILLYGVMSL